MLLLLTPCVYVLTNGDAFVPGGLSERQLLAIALLATLIPLILIVLIVFSYR